MKIQLLETNTKVTILVNDRTLDKFIFTNDTEETLSQLYNILGEDRIIKITELLRLNHFNQEELDHVKKLITKHSDRFQIPDEPLKCINAAMHSIPTVDERPILSKQNRFPPTHKE